MRLGLIFLLCFSTGWANGQQFGGHPPSQRWKQIKTPTGRIIFPVGWDSTAQRVASLMKAIHDTPDSSSFKLTRPVPVILQHRSTISNGYVALAPFRSEWYMTPPINPFTLGSLPWPDQLGIHEQRHMQQYQQYNRGGAKLFRWVLGEQGQALANALTVPDWFFEGDAVFQETFLSQQGRGRIPFFYNGYRSIWESDKNYSYQKLRNGSYRDYVPNHYQLGYLLVTEGYRAYGPEFWKKVTDDAAAMKGLFYPFQKAVKRYSGQSFAQFREKALAQSRIQLTDTGFRANSPVRPVINEENPVYTETGELLFQRSSYSELPAFYLRRADGIERSIRVRDRSLDNYFSYARGKIVYASYRPATRWSWIDYSELQLLDITTSRQISITTRTRYFTPALSATGDSVVAVQLDAGGLSNLHILNTEGKLLQVIKNDSNYLYSFPAFNGKEILTASRNRKGEMTLQQVNIQTGEHQNLLPWSKHLFGYPTQVGDTILFTLSINGRERTVLYHNNQLAFVLEEESASSSGLYQPTLFGHQLSTMQFTAGGYKLKQTGLTPVSWKPAHDFFADPIFANNPIVYAGKQGLLLEEYPIEHAAEKAYSKLRQFFRFHSWTPWFEEPEFSLTAHSQNLLNTFQSQVYGVYNRNEQFKQIGFSGIFGGWFPYVRGGVDYTFDRKDLYRNRVIRWNEMELQAGLQIPLNLSKGRQISYLSASSDIVFNQPSFRQPEKDSLGNLSYTYLDNSLQFSIQSQQARQHINPHWASSVRLQYRSAINRYSSQQWLAAGSQYFPGISQNHSLVLSWAIGGRDSLSGIRFSNNFPFARGYENFNVYRSQKWGLTYHFPIAYPDAGAWNILYLLRVRAAGFLDWAQAKDPKLFERTDWINFRSAGLECYFDTRWWNQLPVSFGIRYAYLLDQDLMGGFGRNRWQFILPINLIPTGVNKTKTNLPGHF